MMHAINNPKVSIICMTYNQEKYIQKAIDGFLSQITNFPFEIIIHDDCSTDNTQSIIEKNVAEHPDIIKAIYENTNLYSQGVRILFDILAPAARGEYIALCEGDDYWINPHKLQRQYDILNQFREINGCAHAAYVFDEKSGNFSGSISPSDCDRTLQFEEVIEGMGGYLATCSLFFRKSVCSKCYKFSQVLSLDYVTQLLISLDKGIFFINEPMSVYRKNVKFSWTSVMNENPRKYIYTIKKIMSMLLELDMECDYKFHSVIRKTYNRYALRNAKYTGDLINYLRLFPSFLGSRKAFTGYIRGFYSTGLYYLKGIVKKKGNSFEQ